VLGKDKLEGRGKIPGGGKGEKSNTGTTEPQGIRNGTVKNETCVAQRAGQINRGDVRGEKTG